MDSFKNMIPT